MWVIREPKGKYLHWGENGMVWANVEQNKYDLVVFDMESGAEAYMKAATLPTGCDVRQFTVRRFVDCHI